MFICDKDNGFITFNIPPDLLDRVINEVLNINAIHAPKNKLRKVIFKDGCGLGINEKLRIVGSLIGRTKINCAVFISGRGSNLKSLIKYSKLKKFTLWGAK